MPDDTVFRVSISVIQVVAGLVAVCSLRHARPFFRDPDQQMPPWWLIWAVAAIVVFSVIFCVRISDPEILLGVVAFGDLVLLAVLLFYTGGPTKSWFTPFLLSLVPLAAMLLRNLLGERGAKGWSLPAMLGVTIAIFLGLLFIPRLTPRSMRTSVDKPRYHKWYALTTFLSTFFPTAVTLGFLKRAGEGFVVVGNFLRWVDGIIPR